MSTVYFLVNSEDVSNYEEKESLTIYNRKTTNSHTASFALIDPPNEPVEGYEVIIYMDNTTQKLFAGIIVAIERATVATGKYRYTLSCIGYQRLFDRYLVTEDYSAGETHQEIISHIIANFTDPAMGFTANNVTYSMATTQYKFNYRYPSDCLREMAESESCSWYIDEDKDIHFFNIDEGATAPLEINDTTLSTVIEQFRVRSDYSQVRNRIYVKGGKAISSPTTITWTGTGTQKIWTLPYNCQDVTLTVGGVAKTLGREFVDSDDGTKDYFYNPYDRTLFCATAEAAPGNGVAIVVSLKYWYPLIVRADSNASQDSIAAIEGGTGVYEYLIQNSSYQFREIMNHAGGRELALHAWPLVEGSFMVTDYYGFKAGQTLTINITGFRFNGTYQIESVQINSYGNSILSYLVNFLRAYNAE